MIDLFAAFGLSASAGLNAYLPMLIVAVSARMGLFTLNAPFDIMTNTYVIGALAVMTVIEMLVDKVPAVDTINDVISTLIRPAAGAVLFAASTNIVSDVSPVFSMVLGLLAAGSVHAAKTAARPAVTATTAGIGNPIVSILEDVLAAFTTLMAMFLPWVVLIIFVTAILIIMQARARRRAKLRARYERYDRFDRYRR